MFAVKQWENDKISTESKEKLEEILARVNRLYPMVDDLYNQISREYKKLLIYKMGGENYGRE